MHRHFRGHCGGGPQFWWAAGGGGRGGFKPFGGGFGGGRGSGGRGRDFRLSGRILGDGDLRLIALALLEKGPHHGYDIIKALEAHSSGAYSPSPGVVYPTLTFLEEAGYASSRTEGSKKVFSITEAGRAHLDEHRAGTEHVLDRLQRFGERMAKAREWFGWDEGDEKPMRGDMPPDMRRLKEMRRRLRHALAEALDADKETRAQALRILEDTIEALEALFRRG